jgi:hypothetical protein
LNNKTAQRLPAFNGLSSSLPFYEGKVPRAFARGRGDASPNGAQHENLASSLVVLSKKLAQMVKP